MRDLPVAAVFIMNLLMIYTVGRNSRTSSEMLDSDWFKILIKGMIFPS